MKNAVYQIAIIGLGGMGNWHRELLETIDGIEVCGSYDIKAERQHFASEKGIYPYESFDEVLADENCDMVLVATPNHLHKEIAIKAMQHGKHVVCEKPAVMCSADLAEIIDVSASTGRLFVVHQNRRWDEDYLTVRRIYEENLLGDIFRIESRVHGSRGIPGDWRQEKEFGGGMVLDWGVHIIDQILQMIPERITSLYASLTHVTNEIVDDGFQVTLNFESGKTVLLEVGTSNFINLPRWYVLGQNGTAVIEDWDLNGEMVLVSDYSNADAVPVKTAAGLTKTMAPRTKETITTRVLPEVKSDIRGFYQNVMNAIAGKESILVKNEEVMKCIQVMEAIFESACEHKIVTQVNFDI